jgi:hypothetical protein
MNNIDDIYEFNKKTPSNIQPEMEMLYTYARKCDHVTEFGFGRGKSSSAFIAARAKKVVSYDIKDQWELAKKWTALATDIGIDFKYIQKSSIEGEIEQTDLLFIDSWHTYTHKKTELEMHNHKVNKYIILHDTKTCAYVGEDGSRPGFMNAIHEFLTFHREWLMIENVLAHNGYIVLERIS